jgi:hypothetical protein
MEGLPRKETLKLRLSQDDIQNELVRRGTADAEDSTMAEYVTVMLSGSEFGLRMSTSAKPLYL